jgi:tetrahydromethanopterin S-methyltransferase subunit B
MEAEDILPDLPIEEMESETAIVAEVKSEPILRLVEATEAHEAIAVVDTVVDSTPESFETDTVQMEMLNGDSSAIATSIVEAAIAEAVVAETVVAETIVAESVVAEEPVAVAPVAVAPAPTQAVHAPSHLHDVRKEVEGLLFTLEQSHDRRISQLSNSHKEMGSLLHSLNDSMKKLEHFEKLDQLKAIEKLTDQLPDRKTLIIRYVLTFGLETVKLLLAGLVVVFLLSRETGREIAVKTLPALGFGSAGQVNLGLKLMMGEASPEEFQSMVADVKKRIDGEIDVAFSSSSFLPLNRRMEILSQVKSYSFKAAGIDLSVEVEKKLQEKLTQLHDNAVAKLGFEQSLAKGKQKTNEEEKIREIKLLLIQKQYPQLLEKALPFWGTSEAVTLAAIEGSAQLLMNDPATLEQIINTHMPGKGKL